jgi:hypothetical protein
MQIVDNSGNVFGINGLEITGPDGKPKGGGSGAQGPAGPQGIQGITGLQGVIGVQGFIGTQGTTGAGTQGTTGSIGPQGVQGIIGTGTQGTQGITGIGIQGTTGVQGIQGPSGGGSGGTSLKGIHILTKPLSGAYYNGMIGSGQTTIGVGSGILYLFPFIPNYTFTITEIAIEITTAAAGNNVKLVIYSDVNGRPTNKIIESTAFDTSTTGLKSYLVSYTFVEGTTYWIGHIGNSFSVAARGITQVAIIASVASGTTIFNAFAISASFASVPSTLSASTSNLTGSAGMIKMSFKAA